MDGFIQKLLDIDILIQDPVSFTRIISYIDNLKKDNPNYIKLNKHTDTLLNVLKVFSTVTDDPGKKNTYRQATERDIILDNTVYIEGDDDKLHEMKIVKVLNPSDEWKAFYADDGCKYGLDGCFVKNNT